MINYELLEAIQANKIMKKEEKINKALLLIEQLTNKKPVLKEIKSEPVTKQVVEEAMRIVSKDVLAPKVVRDGLLKETVEKPIKRRFYAVTDDFEKQAKRLIAFYNDMLVLHPELKSEANKVKRALGSIEGSFTNTEMFINENKKEEQLELDLKEETLQEETESSDLSFENWKKALHLYDTSSLESDVNRHESNGIKPTEEQDKALTQLFRGSKVTSRFIMRSDFGRWKTLATLANYNKDCKDFGKQKVDDLVNKVLNIYTPLLKEESTDTTISHKTFKYTDKNLEGRHLTKLVRALSDQDLEKYIQRINDREAILTVPTNESEIELFNDVVEFAVGKHNLVLTEDVRKGELVKVGDTVGNTVQGFNFKVLQVLDDKFKVQNTITGKVFETFAQNMYHPTLTEDIAGMTTASMAAFDGGLGIKPAAKKKLKEAYGEQLSKGDLKSEIAKLGVKIDVIDWASTGGFFTTYDNISKEELQDILTKLFPDVYTRVSAPIKSVETGYYLLGYIYLDRDNQGNDKPLQEIKRPLKEAASNGVSAGDTVDTKYGKLVILANPQFGRSKYKIPVMSLNTFNSLATTKRVETSNVPVEFLTVSAGWMAAVKPGLKVPTEHLKKVWNLYVGKRDEITVKKSEMQQNKFDAAAPLINWSNVASDYVVTMVDGNTAKVGDKVDIRFSNGIFSGTIKSIAGRGDGAVGILFRGRTKAKMVAPKIILKHTEYK